MAESGALRDAIAAALAEHLASRPDFASWEHEALGYPCCAEAVLEVVAREPWSGWQWVGTEPLSTPEPELSLLAQWHGAPHLGPYRGVCAFCGHPDARHREVDAGLGMAGAGDAPEDVDQEYGWPAGTCAALLAGWRPDDWRGTSDG